MPPPDAVALEYARELKAISRAVSRELAAAYLPALAGLLSRQDGMRLDAADDARRLSQKARRIAARETRNAESLAAQAVRRTDAFVVNQLRAQSVARVGVNLFAGDVDLREKLAGFVRENARLIKSLATEQIGEVEGIVRDAVARGRRHETVAREIQERFDISERRAAIIARDQVGTANAQISQARQEAAGVAKYTWMTSNDERVRELHEELNGQVFAWDDPPVSGVKGERQHPGEPILCRCQAIPYLEDVYAQLAAGGSF